MKGADRDRAMAAQAWLSPNSPETCAGHVKQTQVIWGDKTQLIACVVEDVLVVRMRFQLVGYGDEITLPE